MDCVVAVLVCGRFFYYVAKDARISNTPPNSELEDRVSLLWTWFAFLAAYVCQLLMAIGLIIGTRKDITVPSPEQTELETVLGNCQLWIYGAHMLNLYTMIELLIVVYYIFLKSIPQGSRAVMLIVLAIIKLTFRVVAFVIVKLFMADLNRPSCSCPTPPNQQQQQHQTPQQLLQQHHQQSQQQTLQHVPHQPQTPHLPQQPNQPQMMVATPQQNSEFQPAAYHHPS